jgi:hypothetical protein
MKQLLIGVGVAAIAALSAGTVALATPAAAPREIITVSPSALDPGGDADLLSGTGCSLTVLGTCHFRISETSGSNKPVQWSVAWINGDGLGFGHFTPSSGTLHPGRSVAVTATGLCDDQDYSEILVQGDGPVAPGGVNAFDTTVAAIAVIYCG